VVDHLRRFYYTNAPGAIGGIICRDDGANPYWYHFDRLGNVMAVTNESGALAACYTQDAFGLVLERGTSTGYSTEHATDPQPYHLTTKEYDDDVDLYFFFARWYQPATGRFLSREMTGLDGMQAFVLGFNNPLRFYDPDGYASVDSSSSSGSGSSSEQGGAGVGLVDVLRGPSNCSIGAVYFWSTNVVRSWFGANVAGPIQNSLRHCVWQCLLRYHCGSRSAKIAGYGHEITGLLNRNFTDTAVDLTNNRIGRELGKCAKEPLDCYKKCRAVLSAGVLRTQNDGGGSDSGSDSSSCCWGP
jgi:RHS repeat-associated protein